MANPMFERFIVRSNVSAAVEYGADGAAYQAVIQAERTLLPMEQPIKYLRPETVTAVLEEIVPVSARGRELGTLYENMGCAHGEEVEYENVVISRDTDQCVPLKPERNRVQLWPLNEAVAVLPVCFQKGRPRNRSKGPF